MKKDRWITIKIPRDLKEEFKKDDTTFTNFTQFAHYAIRKELNQIK